LILSTASILHSDDALARIASVPIYLARHVLIATGTADIVIPPSNALRLVNAIPGAWLAQFNGGGHAFMAQYPRRLADLINSFLELG
jgi:pimeloyl-ACP methyl ester carboxylesterase